MANVANKKAPVCDAHGSYPSIWYTQKPVFAKFDWFVVLTSCLNAYISKYGDFCANDNDDDDNNNTTNYFTPCTCVQGKYQLTFIYTHNVI